MSEHQYACELELLLVKNLRFGVADEGSPRRDITREVYFRTGELSCMFSFYMTS